MGFVKLDSGMLTSTLWAHREEREVFITALLMAEPRELREATPQLEVDSLKETGFIVPPGWYGFVAAAGPGILRQALVKPGPGMAALKALGQPDAESRSKEHEGRRMVRVDGGYILLNYIKYRDRDYTAARRMKDKRERDQSGISRKMHNQSGCCDCCGRPFERPYSRYVVQDHDHKSLVMRGLVCQSCNRVVGMIERGEIYKGDSRDLAVAYLEKWSRVSLQPERNDTRNDTHAEAEAEYRSTTTSTSGPEPQSGPPAPAAQADAAAKGGKPKKLRTTDLKAGSMEAFQAAWDSIPKTVLRWNQGQRRDIEEPVAKGSRAQAERRFQAIVDQGLATPRTLYVAFWAYLNEGEGPRKGYVQHMASFFGPDKATWREWLDRGKQIEAERFGAVS